MKRYFLARMGDYEYDGAIYPAVAKYLASGAPDPDMLSDESRCNRATWAKYPEHEWGIGIVAAGSLQHMQSDPDIYLLPDASHDVSWGALPVSVRNAAVAAMQAAGFVTVYIKTSHPYHQVLDYLIQQRQPQASCLHADIQDVIG